MPSPTILNFLRLSHCRSLEGNEFHRWGPAVANTNLNFTNSAGSAKKRATGLETQEETMTALPNKQYTEHTKIQRKKVDWWRKNLAKRSKDREMWSAGFRYSWRK